VTSRSNSAMAVSPCNSGRPLDVVVSIYWSSSAGSTPRAANIGRQRLKSGARGPRGAVHLDARLHVTLAGPDGGRKRVEAGHGAATLRGNYLDANRAFKYTMSSGVGSRPVRPR
jgi:hypothetical protein